MAGYTKKALMVTFEQMLYEQSFDRITVSALVQRCGVSPNTFYYHYDDIYAMLEAWLEEKKRQFLAATGGQPLEERLKAFLHAMQREPRWVRHLSGSVSRERMEKYVFTSVEGAFYDALRAAVAGRGVPEELLRQAAGFVCYSFLGFLIRFFWEGMQADVDSSVDTLCALSQRMLKSLLPEDAEQTEQKEADAHAAQGQSG